MMYSFKWVRNPEEMQLLRLTNYMMIIFLLFIITHYLVGFISAARSFIFASYVATIVSPAWASQGPMFIA